MKSFHDDLADELDIDMLGLSTSDNESMLEDLYGSDCEGVETEDESEDLGTDSDSLIAEEMQARLDIGEDV